MSEEKNYIEEVIESTHQVLTEKTIPWPHELSVEHKKMLVSKMIKYYKDIEDFAKCSELEDLLKTLV